MTFIGLIHSSEEKKKNQTGGAMTTFSSDWDHIPDGAKDK